jgi:anti-sigma regulatory factor (Ser/Thr protein kinase)
MNASSLAHTRTLPPFPGAARRELQDLLEDANWPGDVDSVVLAVHEALMNSQRHAGGAISACVGLDGTEVVVEVCDGGPGFDVPRHAARPPEVLAEQGRGLWLISQIADSWDVRKQRGETCLTLRFRP